MFYLCGYLNYELYIDYNVKDIICKEPIIK
jgi:hypothetical protein